MVEFALIIALFLAIFFGIVEFGRAWYYSNHLGNSVRAAARYGAVFAHETGISTTYKVVGTISSSTTDYANAEISGFMNGTPGSSPGQFLVTVSFSRDNAPMTDPAPKRGDTIKVTATYNYQILTGTIIPNFGLTQLVRSASMPIE